jgi:hypothetical protein
MKNNKTHAYILARFLTFIILKPRHGLYVYVGIGVCPS